MEIMLLLLPQEKAACVQLCKGSSMDSLVPKPLGRGKSREYKVIA